MINKRLKILESLIIKYCGEDLFNLPNFNFYQVIDVINELGDNQKDPERWHQRFLDINSDIFLKDMPVKKISKGYFGEAWLTESGNVFKVFRNIGALKFYEEEIENFKNDPDNSLNVYDFGTFRLPQNTNLFGFKENILGWAIMEKLKTTKDIEYEYTHGKSSLFSNAIYKILNYVINLLNKENEERLPVDIENLSPKEKSDYIVDKLFPSSDYIQKSLMKIESSGVSFSEAEFKRIIESIIIQLDKGRTDPSGHNFGYRDNNIIFFDSFEAFKNDIPPYEEMHKDEIYWDNQDGPDSYNGFTDGMKVSIVSGMYEGMSGTVTNIDGNSIEVSIVEFGRPTTHKFKTNELKEL
jgi:transcription antitermination factor NusG